MKRRLTIIKRPYTWLPSWLSCKESASSAEDRRSRFDPQVRKIPWRRAWHPTPLFLPGESHGLRKLVGYQSTGSKRVRHDWSNWIHAHTHLALTYFPTQLLGLGNWFLNLLLGYWTQIMKMAGRKVFLADTATAMVSNIKMVNNPVGTWKLSIFKCTSQHLSSHGLWFQRILHVFVGFT